jgi:hypothetical protein
MTSTSAGSAGSSNTNAVHQPPAGTGHFMLTLCRLDAPVSIRPPQSPRLKPFTFFMSCVRALDGSERLYLHMGYFATLADAERWLEGVRGRFPDAIATFAPAALSQSPNSEVPAVPPADSQPAPPESSHLAPVAGGSLTDTQVLRILETRPVVPVQDNVADRNCDQVALLRPDDTETRRALKEAVVQGAPVSFAVQLQWSEKPIDLSRVPVLAVFKTYTLYATESRRDGHARYFLRLGFFGDPISAKQVAVEVRSNFASAAVVPVAEQEVAHAREASMHSSSIPHLMQQPVGGTVDTPGSTTASKPVIDRGRSASRRAETLEETLKRLAEREMLTDSDSLSETGVRHLRVDVQEEHTSGRSEGI